MKKKPKLVLHRETVRSLESGKLANAAGASHSCFCTTMASLEATDCLSFCIACRGDG